MYYYIINPAAGRGTINTLQDKLRARLNHYGISGEFAKTTGTGDAVKMAKAATERGFTTIVAVGGDGTVNEVVNGVAQSNAAVGIIPIGNSNKLANHLGIRDWQQACAVLSARRLVSYGLIAAGQKFFLSTLTLGFETDLDKRLDTDQDGLGSRVRNFSQGWGHASKFTPLKCHITVDDQYEVSCNIFSLSVTNQKFDNPAADNRLVVSIIDKPSTRQLTSYLWHLLKRSPIKEDATTTQFFANRLVIKTTPPTGITFDGKVAGRTPIAIRLTDRHVRFIAEKQSTGFKP